MHHMIGAWGFVRVTRKDGGLLGASVRLGPDLFDVTDMMIALSAYSGGSVSITMRGVPYDGVGAMQVTATLMIRNVLEVTQAETITCAEIWPSKRWKHIEGLYMSLLYRLDRELANHPYYIGERSEP